ncbi:beta-xylosidase [Alteromonas aestuariivivens]|uniref:Beta-xylosidase n=1 Tax=Alteromonas aestuariivivens TaxID=1938339 RepID=A0A3D8MCM8_9ALTE|nr:glycoside hydrolase family 43 protein [Alteromonas aestuariivivens]RDV27990.1 beta-xylosidase [Alteromonas aestuariivivens]
MMHNSQSQHLRCSAVTAVRAAAMIFSTTFLSLSAMAAPQQIELADPSIFVEDGRYVLFGTEPPPQTGFRAYESNDSLTWQPVDTHDPGYVLKAGSDAFGDKGFWAPQLFRHKNQYKFAYTANEQIAIAEGLSATGPFSQPHPFSLSGGLRQIDPFVFFDDDGSAYLYHVRLNKGNHIFVAQLNEAMDDIKPDTLTHCLSALPGSWERTESAPKANVVEGPTVIKHQGKYHLFYSANHFKSPDYAVGYAIADSPLGPWQRYENNPILDSRNTGLSGPGHGDAYRDQHNQWFYVFHAHASHSEVHPRKTWLAPISWQTTDQSGPQVRIEANQKRPLLFRSP